MPSCQSLEKPSSCFVMLTPKRWYPLKWVAALSSISFFVASCIPHMRRHSIFAWCKLCNLLLLGDKWFEEPSEPNKAFHSLTCRQKLNGPCSLHKRYWIAFSFLQPLSSRSEQDLLVGKTRTSQLLKHPLTIFRPNLWRKR